jgi:hypothetical protein
MYLDEYKEFLKESNFNEKQIEFILNVRKNYDFFEQEEEKLYQSYDDDGAYRFEFSVRVDNFERELSETFNKSGLFEEDDESNMSEIYNWGQEDTREYITEVEVKFFTQRERI